MFAHLHLVLLTQCVTMLDVGDGAATQADWQGFAPQNGSGKRQFELCEAAHIGPGFLQFL